VEGQLHLGRHPRCLLLDQREPASKNDKLTTSYIVSDIANLVMVFVGCGLSGKLVIEILCIPLGGSTVLSPAVYGSRLIF
jgi:hypothetical protein